MLAAYPPVNTAIRKFLLDETEDMGQEEFLVRFEAFLHAVFEVVNNRLKAIDDDQSSMLSY